MSNKTLSILTYVTIIGWLIAFILNNDNKTSNSLVCYHLKQGFGIFIVSLLINIPLTIIAYIIPSLSFLGLIGYVFIVLWVFGIINAINEQEKPLPFIGKFFEDKFAFIK